MAGKRKSAFSAALREAQQQSSETVEQQHSETVKPSNGETASMQYGETVEQLHSNTVIQSHRETAKGNRYNKISVYITPEQERKLDDLAYEHGKRTGKRLNRNDIVRFLIAQAGAIPDDAQFD